jgi:hypothetical protein
MLVRIDHRITHSFMDWKRSQFYLNLAHNSRFSQRILSGLLRRVGWWLETNVSETVLPPSSGLKFVIMHNSHFHGGIKNLF